MPLPQTVCAPVTAHLPRPSLWPFLMHDPRADELAGLVRMTVTQLRARYATLFGEPTRAGNKAWLVKRIAWRLQALAEGDLSERPRRRDLELANDADLRLSPPPSSATTLPRNLSTPTP